MEKQKRKATSNHKQPPVCCMRVWSTCRKCSWVCKLKILKNILKEVTLHLYTCLLCECTQSIQRSLLISRSHSPTLPVLSLKTDQCSCYTLMGGSCLALCVGQHSQTSVCMTERMDLGKGLCFAAGGDGSFQVHFDVLYSYQCYDWWINIPKGVPIHIESFDGSVRFQSWSWIVYRLGSGPHNLHLVQHGRKLLWNLRKIWKVPLFMGAGLKLFSEALWVFQDLGQGDKPWGFFLAWQY